MTSVWIVFTPDEHAEEYENIILPFSTEELALIYSCGYIEKILSRMDATDKINLFYWNFDKPSLIMKHITDKAYRQAVDLYLSFIKDEGFHGNLVIFKKDILERTC